MRFKLIINPIAGGRKGKTLTEKILERLRTWGISFEHEFSRYIGHATEIARQSAKRFDAIVAVGTFIPKFFSIFCAQARCEYILSILSPIN